jgi:5-formyltetrahydrofolate cyclo-ligase
MAAQPPDLDVTLWRKARRPELIARRLALSAAERVAASERITAQLEAALAEAPGRLVGFYWPFKGEYDPRPLVRSLHQAGVALAQPVVVAKAQPLIFRPWWPGVAMTHGVWSIPIPAGGEPVQPDTLLVPLVGFDSENFRLGYGGGFYDRTLAKLRALGRVHAIGYAYAGQEVDAVPRESYDQPLDWLATEESLRPVGKGS